MFAVWLHAAGALAASVPTKGQLDGMAQRIASAWVSQQQQSSGVFIDPYLNVPSPGYGTVMLGAAQLKVADAATIAAGLKAVDSARAFPATTAGVFEQLGFTVAYRRARLLLARDPGFLALRAGWEQRLADYGLPVQGPAAAGCVHQPGCFHNHEVVGAVAELELLSTGLGSSTPGALLGTPSHTLQDALYTLGRVVPRATGHHARSSGPGPRSGLGVLVDSDTPALAYNGLSLAMLARGVRLLGRAAPRPAAAALRRGLDATAALMAPDGDVAYVGRRQEQSWALAGVVDAMLTGIAALAPDARTTARWREAAGLAYARLVRLHPVGPLGLDVVPREVTSKNYYSGIDLENLNFNGLTSLLLNDAAGVASDASRVRGSAHATLAGTSHNGWYLDRGSLRLAVVRRHSVWFAVHGRRGARDARADFGLLALKLHRRGGWVDLIRPRPRTFTGEDTAGPVVVHGRRRLLPTPGSLGIDRRGRITVQGGLQDTAASGRVRRTTFRFEPTARGVTLRFPARAGDAVSLTTYLPAAEARIGPTGTIGDHHALATLGPGPVTVTTRPGYASCCDAALVAVTQTVTLRHAATVTYAVRAR